MSDEKPRKWKRYARAAVAGGLAAAVLVGIAAASLGSSILDIGHLSHFTRK